MRAETVNLIGVCAGALTTLSFVPQVWRTYKRKSAKDLSWGYLSAFTLGVALWLAYGLLSNSEPVLLANAVTLALLVGLVWLKEMYK